MALRTIYEKMNVKIGLSVFIDSKIKIYKAIST